MAWPADTISTANIDNGITDKPSMARPDLLNLANIVKAMLANSPVLMSGTAKLGLGGTPNPGWGAAVQVIQMSAGTAFFSFIDAAGYNNSGIVSGAYYDGAAWRYTAQNIGAAVLLMSEVGAISQQTAPVSAATSAGAALTWESIIRNKSRGASYYQDTSGAGAYPGAGVSGIAGFQQLAFLGQNYDSDALANVAKDRFTIPAGVSWIRLEFALRAESTNTTGEGVYVETRKNGIVMNQDGIVGGFYGRASGTNGSTVYINAGGATAPIQVVPGDYFEIWARSTLGVSGFAKITDEGSWFAMEILK